MSYNDASTKAFKYKDFSINDLNALAQLWGTNKTRNSSLKTRTFPADCGSQTLETLDIPMIKFQTPSEATKQTFEGEPTKPNLYL